jgi:riboflavin biosynthesis pyrimidine reductase
MTEDTRVQPNDGLAAKLKRLYPAPAEMPLPGLYLCEDLRALIPAAGAFVYANFIVSLDGRIALSAADTRGLKVPDETANPRDWRLLLELAAPADAIVMSGRYLRQLAAGTAQAWPPFADDAPSELTAFRRSLGLSAQPTLVIVTRSLDLPGSALECLADRRLIVATVDHAPSGAEEALKGANVEVLRLGSESVDGARLVSALAERGLRLVYSTAGPAVLHMLLNAGVLQRLYLTTVLRVLGGDAIATLVRGTRLKPPYDFSLSALYLDHNGPDGVAQLMQVYDRQTASNRL